MALVLPLGPLWPALLRGGRSAGDTELCPTQAHRGWGAELRFGGATASLPAVSSPRLWVGLRWVPGAGPCVPGRVQSWGVRCEHSGGTALSARGQLRQTLRSGEGGHSRASSPLSPAPSPSLPHLTVLAGVHGGAQGAAEVFDKVPGVAEGADNTVLVGAVGVGDQPFVGALGRPDGAPDLTEREHPQG